MVDINILHKDVYEKVEAAMPKDNSLTKLAAFYKNFADGTRLKILYALSISEMCVYDITAIVEISQSAVSHQLRLLKSEGLVDSRKQGKIVTYYLKDSHVKEIIETGLEHIKEK